MARVLDVYLKEDLAGYLEQTDSGTMRFRYAETWLSAKAARPLSVSLPLQPESFGRNACRPFFAGLLPEENSRKLVAKAFGVSDRNDFALLEKIGAECAGAVSILPPGEAPITGTDSYREISLEELAGKFAALPLHPLLAGEERIRLSLAGAQGKLAVAIRDGNYFLPLDGSPSSHILKPRSLYFEGVVENEFFCMRLAAEVGLDVAGVELKTAEKIEFLQVERFDRKPLPDGRWGRVHQEDFCQALGIPPELKYQQEGGPNLKKCFALVRAVSAVPGPDVLRLFDAVVFNFLVGNSDAHGKNFSFLYDGSSARLAPFYDLVCTRAYPHIAEEMAMKIGDERKPSLIAARNWRKFFKEVGFGPALAERRLLDLVGRVQQAAQRLSRQDLAGANQVGPVVTANCERLLAEDWEK